MVKRTSRNAALCRYVGLNPQESNRSGPIESIFGLRWWEYRTQRMATLLLESALDLKVTPSPSTKILSLKGIPQLRAARLRGSRTSGGQTVRVCVRGRFFRLFFQEFVQGDSETFEE